MCFQLSRKVTSERAASGPFPHSAMLIEWLAVLDIMTSSLSSPTTFNIASAGWGGSETGKN